MEHEKLADQLFFSKEAADFLGITVQRLNKLVQEGKLLPVKKSASGAIFHIKDLEKRKEELAIFTTNKIGVSKGLFLIDSQTKQEAVNYSTIMNVLGLTDSTLEPLFDDLGDLISISKSLDNNKILEEYAKFFKVSSDTILREYKITSNLFSQLRETDEIIKRGDPDYPPMLADTEQAPRFLYLRGKKSLLFEKRTVALVGSRNASDDAKKNTRRLAKALGENGITVVSGLAKGIDVTAHIEALKNGFNTIAVIGTNLNQYYPIENKPIQLEIEKHGLIVSQFSPAAKTQRWFFPLRNGVMSGLSLATIIMEAGETSGALKQADFALKQGRQVLIPESALRLEKISWPAKYVNKGATVVRYPSEVLSILARSNIFNINNNKTAIQQSMDDLIKSNESDSEREPNITTPIIIKE